MATETKVMGWLQIVGGLVAVWATFRQNWTVGIAMLGLVFVAMGYHHLTKKGK